MDTITMLGSERWVDALSRRFRTRYRCIRLPPRSAHSTASAMCKARKMSSDCAPSGSATILAVGDVMLCNETALPDDVRRQERRLGSLRAGLGDADLLFANLETTLLGGEGCIAKEPRLHTGRDPMARALTALQANVVSLANNHAFDCYASGFAAVGELLGEKGIRSFGAGLNAGEAVRPLVTTVNGMRIGWLGFVEEDTHPSHVATADGYGVRLLEPESATREVRALSASVDAVIVSVHWGVEYCHLPSPRQILVARSLIDSGARVVLGHHAHVIQGVETHGGGVIAYGLGNTITTDLKIRSRLAIKQSRRTNTALALRLVFSRVGNVDYEAIPYLMNGERAHIGHRYARRVLTRANHALKTASPARWRRRRLLEDVVLRPLWKLDPRVIRSVNWGHAKKLLASVVRSTSPARDRGSL